MDDTPTKDGAYSRQTEDGNIEVVGVRDGGEAVRFVADQKMCVDIISRLFVELDASAKQNTPAQDSLYSVAMPPPAMIGTVPLQDPNFVALSLVVGTSRLLVPIPTDQAGEIGNLLAKSAADRSS